MKQIRGISKSSKDGSVKPCRVGAKSIIKTLAAGGWSLAENESGKAVRIKYTAPDPSPEKRLQALKRLEGIWANKDTSFFDKKHA